MEWGEKLVLRGSFKPVRTERPIKLLGVRRVKLGQKKCRREARLAV